MDINSFCTNVRRSDTCSIGAITQGWREFVSIADVTPRHIPVDRVMVAMVDAVDTDVVDGRACDGRVFCRQLVPNHARIDDVGIIRLRIVNLW